MSKINKINRQRFWEIDFLRGIAVIMMIIFHFIFDWSFFGSLGIEIGSGFWWLFARSIAVIFIFLAGVSLTLSYSRAVKELKTAELFSKYLARGLKVFSWGLVITFITWLFLKEGFVIFGILHFIGISIILAYPFLKIKENNSYLYALFGIFFIVVGIYLKKFLVGTYYLLWLGFVPETLYTVDYFPLLPWFGLILLGMFFGRLLYKGYKRAFKFPDLSGFSAAGIIRIFCFLGRNSLLIYLAHQPVLVGLLYLFVI